MFLRLTAACFALMTFGFADTLVLKSGTTIQGNYAGGDTRHVKIVVGDHVETYSLDEVARLEFHGNARTETRYTETPPPPPPATQPDYRTERRYEETPPPTTSTNNGGVEVPVGTVLVVRMIDNVDSDRDSIGKTFRASLDEPVVVNGQTLLPRGADIVAKLVDERQSGKFEGRAVLTLDLMQIMMNGRMVDITTSSVSQASGSRGSRTAKTVGGGAVLGAILGGVFGGGRGAAIGATSGAAVGGGAEVMTHGQRVKIPSETRLSFTLQTPIRG
ncbi:MAG: hypothetical protein ACR2NN_20850 [Bryobacteraceae bacterium]